MSRMVVKIAVSPAALTAVRATAHKKGLSVTALVHAAIASSADGARPLASGPEALTVRLPVKLVEELRAKATTRGESLSSFLRTAIGLYLGATARAGAGSPSAPASRARRETRLPRTPAPATATPHSRARTYGTLQICGHRVRQSEVNAAGSGGLVWCRRCQKSRYPERS